MKIRTREQVRAEFTAKGWSYSGWALKRGYSPNLVIAILHDDQKNPRRPCRRGESHNIAVELGIKTGEISRPSSATHRQLAAA